MNEETSHETHDFINKRLAAIKNQRNTGELEDLALIIGEFELSLTSGHIQYLTVLCADGKSLTYALEKEISKTFLELAIMCKAVICCECLFTSGCGAASF